MSPAADEKAELGHHGFTCFYGDDKSVPKSKFTITTNWFDIIIIVGIYTFGIGSPLLLAAHNRSTVIGNKK
jgi:hypothetical protein